MTAFAIKTNFRKNDYVSHRVGSPIVNTLFIDFIKETIDRKRRRISEGHANNIKTVIYHIDRFCDKYDAVIYTNSVTSDFLDDFINYLEEEGLRKSYIKAIVDMVKGMAKRAGYYGYAVDPTYDEVKVTDEKANTVFLSMNEITRIYYFVGLTKFQKRIRDLFIVGCLTGLRYSDYSTLTPENFSGDFIVKMTKKTKKKVIIPVHDYVREIYAKYDGEISQGLTIQHFNRYIKMICKKVGINDKVIVNYTQGGKMVTKTKEKWEMISSHTARRSAATNMYLTGRLKTYEIMSVTGHSTESAFFRYIRITGEDTAQRVQGDAFFRK